jgi:RNA-directed DNA polymerase
VRIFLASKLVELSTSDRILTSYGVSFNLAHVRKFLHSATRIFWKWLNRRSQRRSMNWDQFHRFLQTHPLPYAKIYHALF